MGNEIHLDCISSRKIRDSVNDEIMSKYEVFANPLGNYRMGNKASEILRDSREKVANSLGLIDPEEIYFTSGPEESSNWAIKGMGWKIKNKNQKILYSESESIRIKNPINWLKKQGYKSKPINILNENGINLDLEDLKLKLDEDIAFVCIENANSEIGYMNEISDISRLVREYSPNTKIICDLSTQIGRGEVNLESSEIDLGIIDSQSFGGPSGLGALYIKPGTRLENYIHGDHSEFGRRSGMQNISLISGMGVAAKEMATNFEKEIAHIQKLTQETNKIVKNTWEEYKINTPQNQLTHGIFNFIPGSISSDILVQEMSKKGFAIAASNGCSAVNGLPSNILKKIGLTDDEALSSVRLSFDHNTEIKNVSKALQILKDITEEKNA